MTAAFLLYLSLVMARPGGNPLPGDITSAMEDAEYGQARQLIDRLLKRPNIAAERRVILYATHATCDVSLGDDAAAQGSYQKLLTLQPTYQPDPNRTSPKVLEVFALVRARMAEQGALDSAYGPVFQPLENVTVGEPVSVKVAFRAAPAATIARAFVRYRRVGDTGFESADLQPATTAGEFSGVVPPSFLQTSEDELAVQYYLDAVDGAGQRLTGVGTAELPLQFKIQQKRVAARIVGKPKNEGLQTTLKVLGLVMPFAIGISSVVFVAFFAGAILTLTALEPGASHFFLKRRGEFAE